MLVEHFYVMGGLTRSAAAQGPLSLVTFSTMLSMLTLLEVACPLAAFGGSMRPSVMLHITLVSWTRIAI